MAVHQANCTLSSYQLAAVLENDKTKAKKWVQLCKELKLTPGKLYANLIFLGLRCQKQKQDDQYFNWDQAKKQDFIFERPDAH